MQQAIRDEQRAVVKASWRAIGAVVAAGLLSMPCGTLAADPDDRRIGWITLDGPVAEQDHPLAWLMGAEAGETLQGLIGRFDDAANRNDVAALVVHIKDFPANLAQISSLAQAMERVRNVGKTIHVFAEYYGPTELLLACAADEIVLQPGGFVSFPGLYAEELYLADTLSLVGLKADMVQVGDYKGASEQMARNSPSEQWSQNIDALLDDMWAQMCERLVAGRGFDEMELAAALDRGWSADAQLAQDLGLIDAAVDALDLKAHVAARAGTDRITTDLGESADSATFDLNNPFAMMSVLTTVPEHEPTRDTIAVIHIEGPIVDGESTTGFTGSSNVGSRTIRKALQRVEEEDLVKGMVVRINSPGGSAMASEMIWQGVRRVAAKKPVYVSIGSMAASGGYYIAVSGDKIFVDPVSIVGSIGVVGGKIVMGGLYEKIGVGVTPRLRGPHADLMSTSEPWTEAQRALIRAEMAEIYDLFAQRVKQGRGDTADLSRIGEGRLFTGRQAIENGMADGLADFDAVVERLAADAGLNEGAYDVMTYPGPKGLMEYMEEMFAMVSAPAGAGSRAATPTPALAPLRAIIGERAWPALADAIEGLMLLRDERVILMMPRAVVIR